MNDAFNAIEARIEVLEAQLAKSPLFRELQILRKTRKDLEKLHGTATSSGLSVGNTQDSGPTRVTMLEGARLALIDKGHPMSVNELVDVLPQYGARVGGAKPAVNLSSILSKRGTDFISVQWHGRRAWWLKDRPMPSPPSILEGAEQMAWERLAALHPKQGDK